MAEKQTFEGNKIKDLIRDSQPEFFNYDGSVWTRTCKEEIINPIEGVISGEIPKWINGSLIQNGPGAQEIGDVMFNHVFDGMALLHRFNICNGKVTYQNRFIESESYKAIKRENRIVYGEFGTAPDPVGNIFQRFLSIFKPKTDTRTDNTVVTIYPIGDDFYAFTETPKIRHFDTKTLETLEQINLGETTGIVFQPSHPVVVEDGSLFNCGMKIDSSGSQYVIFGVPNTEDKFKNIKIVARIPPKRKNNPSYMHSFAYTKNYFVVIEQPFTIAVYSLMKSLFFRMDFLDAFKWFENEPAYIHLIDRKTGEVAHTFETETFFFFHTINAYEDNDQVVLDIICYKDPELVKALLIKNMRSLQQEKRVSRMLNSRALRFVFPLKYSIDDKSDKNLITSSGTDAKAYMQSNGNVLCFPELLCDYPLEFGTLHFEKHYARKYRYIYAVGMDIYTQYPGQLIKIDTVEKSVLTWHEDNVYPSEALFVPSPNATSEDDGVVVCALLRGKEDTNFIGLLILDAKSFKEIGRCEFKDLPAAITKTFHGWFLNEKQ